MTVYAKKVMTTDKRFAGRGITLASYTWPDFPDLNKALRGEIDQKPSLNVSTIPVPDTSVLCGGCNENLHPDPGFGYLVYFDKHELKVDHPYDIYCEGCLKKYFKGYKGI